MPTAREHERMRWGYMDYRSLTQRISKMTVPGKIEAFLTMARDVALGQETNVRVNRSEAVRLFSLCLDHLDIRGGFDSLVNRFLEVEFRISGRRRLESSSPQPTRDTFQGWMHNTSGTARPSPPSQAERDRQTDVAQMRVARHEFPVYDAVGWERFIRDSRWMTLDCEGQIMREAAQFLLGYVRGMRTSPLVSPRVRDLLNTLLAKAENMQYDRVYVDAIRRDYLDALKAEAVEKKRVERERQAKLGRVIRFMPKPEEKEKESHEATIEDLLDLD